MGSRLIGLLLTLVLVFALIPMASAQNTECFNLSAADCEIITAAEANSENITSFNLGLDFGLSVTGIPEGDVSITASAAGPLVVNPAMMTAENPVGGLAAALNANLAIKGGGEDETIPLNFVIKDGNFYLQDPTSQQWIGFSIMEAVGLATSQMGALGVPLDLSTLMGSDASALGDMTELMSQFEALGNIPGFINYQRLPDEVIGNQTMYPFGLTVDFVPLLKSPQFSEIVVAMMTASGQEMEGVTGEQLGMMIPMLLGNSTATMSITQWVGSSDQFIHRIRLDIDANIDPTGFAAFDASAGGAATTQMSPIVFDMSLQIDLNDINSTFDIQVPEGATVIPLSSMMGSS